MPGVFPSQRFPRLRADKKQYRKLRLKLKPAVWFRRSCELYGLKVMPLIADVPQAAAALPVLHKDPFDRVLATTAMVHGFTILAPDKKIYQYPKLKTV